MDGLPKSCLGQKVMGRRQRDTKWWKSTQIVYNGHQGGELSRYRLFSLTGSYVFLPEIVALWEKVKEGFCRIKGDPWLKKKPT